MQIALGGTDANGDPKIGYNYAQALKKAAGLSGRFFESRLAIEWLRKHPGWQIRDVYPAANPKQPRTPTGRLAATADRVHG